MPKDKTHSHARLLRAAKEDFLTHGYEKASMRSIAAKAGLTGGALYKHFGGKEAMFSALLEPVYQEMLELYRRETEKSKSVLVSEGVEAFEKNAAASSHRLLELVYRHPDEFWLMFHAPKGSRFADIRSEMVRLETESTEIHREAARMAGFTMAAIPERTMRVFLTMSMMPLFEVIEQRVPYQEAVGMTDVLAEAQNAAWIHLVNLTAGNERKD